MLNKFLDVKILQTNYKRTHKGAQDLKNSKFCLYMYMYAWV